MLLHTITGLHPTQMAERGMPLSFQFARFLKFMLTEIFPGGRLPSIEMVQERAGEGGFTVARIQSLQPHYAKRHSTGGPRRWPRTRTRPSRSSPTRCTSGTGGT